MREVGSARLFLPLEGLQLESSFGDYLIHTSPGCNGDEWQEDLLRTHHVEVDQGHLSLDPSGKLPPADAVRGLVEATVLLPLVPLSRPEIPVDPIFHSLDPGGEFDRNLFPVRQGDQEGEASEKPIGVEVLPDLRGTTAGDL